MLQRTLDTVLEGNPPYSLRFYERNRGWRRLAFGPFDYSKLGHAILGPVLSARPGWVERQIVKTSGADIRNAAGGWISGWGGTAPDDFGDTDAPLVIESADGLVLPCWQSDANSPSSDWVIHVHGRGATAAETARNFALVSELGFNNLAMHYRGDRTAMRNGTPDRSVLALGTTEWVDLEAIVSHLDATRAQRIFVVGWSYGAAICLQFAKKSQLSHRIEGYFFDSPVISWRQTLIFQAKLSYAPRHFATLGENFLKNEETAKSIGLSRGINFDEFEVATIAKFLNTPTVIVHSQDDGFIPIEPCRSLARARPDLVKLVEFTGARHCKLLNHAADAYQSALAGMLTGQPTGA